MGRGPAERSTRWAAGDTWADYDRVAITADPGATITPTVTAGGRGRLTGQAAAAPGNHREAFLHPGTAWADSEVRALWWGGSVFDIAVATPQPGHLHRVQRMSDGRWHAYAVTANVFGSDPNVINLNVWQWDGTVAGLGLGDNGASGTFNNLDRSLRVHALERLNFGGWLNLYYVQPTHCWGLSTADVVTPNVDDATFDEAAQVPNAVDRAMGVVTIPDAVDVVAVATKAGFGAITPATHRRWWPYWVASRLRGTTLSVKVWRYLDAEPDWGSAAHVAVGDFATGAANDPVTEIAPVGRGLCGLIAGHLRNGCTLEFGDVTFRRMVGGEYR